MRLDGGCDLLRRLEAMFEVQATFPTVECREFMGAEANDRKTVQPRDL